MRKLILIGGAPGVGKSYLARKMSEELKLPWVSTDGIREMMREVVRKEDFPELSRLDESIKAEEYLSAHTAKQILESQNKESVGVWKGVTAFVETDYVWNDFIVEGIAVLPELVSTLDKQKNSIKPIFLIDNNEARIKKMVYERGVWDDAEKYSNEVKGVEVEWVVMFNCWLENEVNKYGYEVERIEEMELTQMHVIDEVKDWLKRG